MNDWRRDARRPGALPAVGAVIARSLGSRWPVLALLFLSAACPSPTETRVAVHGTSESLAGAGQGIVLFPSLQGENYAADAQILECISRRLKSRLEPGTHIVGTTTFQDSLFPWFEAEQAPSTAKDMNDLVTRPLIRDRISAIGVRYLVTLAAAEETDGFPGMLCGAGYGGAGCFGFSWEDRTTSVSAVIWDLMKGMEAGSLSVTSEGRSTGVAFVLPIVFSARTDREACTALADRLAALLANKTRADDRDQ